MQLKKKHLHKPEISIRVKLLRREVCGIKLDYVLQGSKSCSGGGVSASHPNILQLSRKGECVHECDEKQILWPVGPPLQHVPVNGSPCHMAALVMRVSFCISDDKLWLPGEPLK